MISRFLSTLLTCVPLCIPSLANANPRPLPFSYPVATLAAGEREVEQIIDIVPVRVERETDSGNSEAVLSHRYELQTELEYGLTDRWELAFYLVAAQGAAAGAPALHFRGIKQRARVRLSEPGLWPLDVGLYFEVAEYHNEIELEQKLLLERRFGKLGISANLWVEQEYYFDTEDTKLIYNPTVGVYYEVTPAFVPGVEWWARGRFDQETQPSGAAASEGGGRHYLGPTVMLQGQELFLTAGVYARLDALGVGVPPGDNYGRLWARVMLGIGL